MEDECLFSKNTLATVIDQLLPTVSAGDASLEWKPKKWLQQSTLSCSWLKAHE